MAVAHDIPGRREGRALRDRGQDCATSGRGRQRSPGRRRRFFLGAVSDGSIDGLLVDSGKQGPVVQPVRVDSRSDADTAVPRRLDACVVVLPKRAYLSWVFEFPPAQPDELADMIRLEAETKIPPDYGRAETAYRELPVGAGEALRRRYEVYLVRAEILERCVEAMDALGLKPSHILPSAVFWDQALGSRDPAGEWDDLLFAPFGDGEYETAHRGRQGEVVVRALSGRGESDLQGGLLESIRAMTGDRPTSDENAIRIGYFDECPPEVHRNGRVRLTDRAAVDMAGGIQATHDAPFLELAARVWIASDHGVAWRSANLMPEVVTARAERRRMFRRLAMGSGAFLAAILLVVAALQVSTWRYRAEIKRLDAAIDRIQTDGEAVGDRLNQLEAVAEARATRNDFPAIVGGLHDAVPPEGDLSYSQVDLRDDGTLLLRGQADSVALPFELPQRLEALAAFSDVQLLDAGQTKKGIGSVSEFRIEAKHHRGGG